MADEQEIDPNKKVIVVSPDGKTGTVPFGQYEMAKSKGYRAATKEEGDAWKTKKAADLSAVNSPLPATALPEPKGGSPEDTRPFDEADVEKVMRSTKVSREEAVRSAKNMRAAREDPNAPRLEQNRDYDRAAEWSSGAPIGNMVERFLGGATLDIVPYLEGRLGATLEEYGFIDNPFTETRQRIRREANPIMTTAAGIAGAIAPALATAGLSTGLIAEEGAAGAIAKGLTKFDVGSTLTQKPVQAATRRILVNPKEKEIIKQAAEIKYGKEAAERALIAENELAAKVAAGKISAAEANAQRQAVLSGELQKGIEQKLLKIGEEEFTEQLVRRKLEESAISPVVKNMFVGKMSSTEQLGRAAQQLAAKGTQLAGIGAAALTNVEIANIFQEASKADVDLVSTDFAKVAWKSLESAPERIPTTLAVAGTLGVASPYIAKTLGAAVRGVNNVIQFAAEKTPGLRVPTLGKLGTTATGTEIAEAMRTGREAVREQRVFTPSEVVEALQKEYDAYTLMEDHLIKKADKYDLDPDDLFLFKQLQEIKSKMQQNWMTQTKFGWKYDAKKVESHLKSTPKIPSTEEEFFTTREEQVPFGFGSTTTTKFRVTPNVEAMESFVSGVPPKYQLPQEISDFHNIQNSLADQFDDAYLNLYGGMSDELELPGLDAYRTTQEMLGKFGSWQTAEQKALMYNEYYTDYAREVERIKNGKRFETKLGPAAQAIGVLAPPIFGGTIGGGMVAVKTAGAGIPLTYLVTTAFDPASTINTLHAFDVASARSQRFLSEATNRILYSKGGKLTTGAAAKATLQAMPKDKTVDELYSEKKDFTERMGMTGNQIDAYNKMFGALDDNSPTVGQKSKDTLSSAFAYLNTKLPKPPSNQPLNVKWEPTRKQKQEFIRQYEYAQDPEKIVTDIVDSGVATDDQIEILNKVHGNFLRSWRKQILSDLVEGQKEGKTLSLQELIRTSKIMGVAPRDASGFSAADLKAMQDVISAPPTPKAGGKVGGGSQLEATPTQERELRKR